MVLGKILNFKIEVTPIEAVFAWTVFILSPIWLFFALSAGMTYVKAELAIQKIESWPSVMGEQHYNSTNRGYIYGYHKYAVGSKEYIREGAPYLFREGGSSIDLYKIVDMSKNNDGQVEVFYNPNDPQESAILTVEYIYDGIFIYTIYGFYILACIYAGILCTSLLHIFLGLRALE